MSTITAGVAPRLVADDLLGRAGTPCRGRHLHRYSSAAVVPGLPVASETLPTDLTSAIHRPIFRHCTSSTAARRSPELRRLNRPGGRPATSGPRNSRVHCSPNPLPVRPPSTPSAPCCGSHSERLGSPGARVTPTATEGRPPSSYQVLQRMQRRHPLLALFHRLPQDRLPTPSSCSAQGVQRQQSRLNRINPSSRAIRSASSKPRRVMATASPRRRDGSGWCSQGMG